jgi:hypothetical protein
MIMKVTEIATQLGVSVPTVYEAIRAGKLPKDASTADLIAYRENHPARKRKSKSKVVQKPSKAIASAKQGNTSTIAITASDGDMRVWRAGMLAGRLAATGNLTSDIEHDLRELAIS